MNLDEIMHIACNLVEFYAIIHKRSTISTSMYDDYDFDYECANDHTYDIEEYYVRDTDLDEDYARDGQDYESLAYRHYA